MVANGTNETAARIALRLMGGAGGASIGVGVSEARPHRFGEVDAKVPVWRRGHGFASCLRSAMPLIASVVLSLAACGGGTVTDSTGPKPPTDTTTTPPGTVQRATLAVQVKIDPADAALAAAVGLTPAGVTVRLARNGAAEAPRTAVTGSDGVARFEQLLEGSYQVSVDRPLSAAEQAKLPAEDRDATLFAAGSQPFVAPPTAAVSLALVASRRGSIVISELWSYSGPGPTLYPWGNYVEFYNNSDTTVYLDGMLFFRTGLNMHRAESSDLCGRNESFRNDSAAVWVVLVHAFPGSGREYPVPPGRGKVLAMDAINHASAAPSGSGQLDLSNADFEFIGSDADVDNPDAANMVRVRAGTGALGRGYGFASMAAYGIALPLASSLDSGLTRGTVAASIDSDTWAFRMSRDRILDVFGVDYSPAQQAFPGSSIRCVPWLAPVFERGPANLLDNAIPSAIRRKTLGRTPDGREILQRTRTSARDFEYGEALRRSLNK